MGQFDDLIAALKAARAATQSVHPTLATAATQLGEAHTLFHTTSYGSHNPTAPHTTQALSRAQEEITEAHNLLTQTETLIQQYLTFLAGQTPETTKSNTKTPEVEAAHAHAEATADETVNGQLDPADPGRGEVTRPEFTAPRERSRQDRRLPRKFTQHREYREKLTDPKLADLPIINYRDASALPYGGVHRQWPTDPRTGNPLTVDDLEFLGLGYEDVREWMNGQAPLGMTKETYRVFYQTLRSALRCDGIDPERVDIRLLGSSTEGFSGPHKGIRDDFVQDKFAVNSQAQARYRDWLGDDSTRLIGRPFDSLNRLGIDEPSDYDLNISSDQMMQRARVRWEGDGRTGEFFGGSHEYVNKKIIEKEFPNLRRWKDWWSGYLGRDVSHAVFAGRGPKDESDRGFMTHFTDDNWIIQKPKRIGARGDSDVSF